MAHLIVVRPLTKADLRLALKGTHYTCDMATTGVEGEVWINAPVDSTPEVIAELRHLIRNVPMVKRRVRNPHYFTLAPYDWKWIQEERLSTSWHTWVCPYSIGQANWYSLDCPSGLTYVLCHPTEPKGAPYYLHSWCRTEEWVAPSADTQRARGPSKVWPDATR